MSSRPPRPSSSSAPAQQHPHKAPVPTSNPSTYAMHESPLSSNPPSPTLSSSGSESVDANRRSDEQPYLQTQAQLPPAQQTHNHAQPTAYQQPYASYYPQQQQQQQHGEYQQQQHNHYQNTQNYSMNNTYGQPHSLHPSHPYHNQQGHSYPHNGNSPNFMVTPPRPSAPSSHPVPQQPHPNQSPNYTPPSTAPATPNPSNPPSASSSLSGHPNRANSDQLKTYLRKKACLYEPTTSHAISYVTWRVASQLSSTVGHFTRQQLQTDVHYICGSQIDSNTVTRTKVNRCMQIILNSCFHYVIPKPSGYDHKSARSFAEAFEKETQDDVCSLEMPGAWSGLKQRFEACLSSPSSSMYKALERRRLGELDSDGPSSSKDANPSTPLHRLENTVLLCFNSNIRSVSDIIYSHNEFIRDIAMSNNLRMTPEDWKYFYLGNGKDSKEGCLTQSPFHDTFVIVPNTVGDEDCGRISSTNLNKFRTSWCEKRYTHESKNCAFAHPENNHGWCRRNPSLKPYSPEMCPNVKFVPSLKAFVNSCEKGDECDKAHSYEEIHYHPKFYKTLACCGRNCNADSLTSGPEEQQTMMRCRGASMDICPFIHYEGYVGSESPSTALQHPSVPQIAGGNTGSSTFSFSLNADVNEEGNWKGPKLSPMIYVNPSPISDFERTMKLPGLVELFRQNGKCLLHHSQEEKRE
ncbi:hypothetical protein TrVE_jg5620 [Triparma verrucosa]|uniref:C3H1-type domain-containing protein n=1 Tax=Triparma verrucosa TaxID=1606542 RepID=A0A9W7FDZ5_9STRA|nr:hypothetical protein TrVE_jg5620 [Triparma verrucosa]